MNVKKVYGKWQDNLCILREIIEARAEYAKYDFFNIGDVDFIINDICVH